MAGGSGGTTVVCVQPQEPATRSAPEPEAEGEAAPKLTPRRRRLRLWIAVAAGVLGILCAGGIGVAVLLYDEETKIERTAPDAVVDSFLRSYFVNRDDKEAALYQCESGGDFRQAADLRSDIVSRESQYTIGIRVSWTDLTVSNVGGQTTVTTELRRAISDGSERTSDSWRFILVDEDGWRVCGAEKLS
jgi:hypothetical protein